MRELIYKDEAYKAIDNCICDSWYRISPADAKMNISLLVSDANRLQGKWIWDEQILGLVCSKCKELGVERSNFCPNCGADTRGIKDE
jgi:rRNA maturation endonuclease Nob1